MMSTTKRFLLTAAIVAAMVLTTGRSAAADRSTIQFGVRAGVQVNSLKFFQNGISDPLSADEKLGYQLGLMSRINLGSLFIQPELIYSSNNFKLSSENEIPGEKASVRVNDKSFRVPLLVGFRIPFIHIFAGPVFNIYDNTTNSIVRSSGGTITTDFTKSAISYQIGAGVDFWRFTLDVRYHGHFKAPVQYISVGGAQAANVKTRLTSWEINLGYFF